MLGLAPPPAVRVLLLTEGTYPYVMGGVSSWCQLLTEGLPEIEWTVFPLTGAEISKRPSFELPPNTRCLEPVTLWSEQRPPRASLTASRSARVDLPAVLAHSLIGDEADHVALVDALVWCRRNPHLLRRSFRSRRAWGGFLDVLVEILAGTGGDDWPSHELDVVQAATIYQTLYWIARVAAAPTPETDLLHVTAAGWAAVPAIVHKALYGTPILLTEHGVYVRESYLAAARGDADAGTRFISTRIGRGLTLACYRSADVVSPVTDSNARWERALGVDPAKIRVIYNGVEGAEEPTPPPAGRRVVSVGRIDPLKDVHTMVRVAAAVLERLPSAEFCFYGPVGKGQEAYARSCHDLHAHLGLDDRCRFMGPTRDVPGALAEANVYLLTSISEALPLAILEAMSHGRPVVATGVGGVPDVARGCGIVAPPGDVHGLAFGVLSMLRDPALAERLGRRGWKRSNRVFNRNSCLSSYGELIGEMTGAEVKV